MAFQLSGQPELNFINIQFVCFSGENPSTLDAPGSTVRRTEVRTHLRAAHQIPALPPRTVTRKLFPEPRECAGVLKCHLESSSCQSFTDIAGSEIKLARTSPEVVPLPSELDEVDHNSVAKTDTIKRHPVNRSASICSVRNYRKSAPVGNFQPNPAWWPFELFPPTSAVFGGPLIGI